MAAKTQSVFLTQHAQNALMDYSKQEQVLGRLPQKRAAVVGAGGLGNFVSLELALSGLDLAIFDFDVVEEKNLHRTPLFSASDIGSPKAEAAARKLREANPEISVAFRNSQPARDDLAAADIVIDCTDNFESKVSLNRLCRELGKPLVAAGISGFDGWVFATHGRPCLECAFASPRSQACDEVGAVPAFVATIASVQAAIATNWAAGRPLPLGTLFSFNARLPAFEPVKVAERPGCACLMAERAKSF
jgi:molybdopterin/thiamine biosynthesis adenylyltransferase